MPMPMSFLLFSALHRWCAQPGEKLQLIFDIASLLAIVNPSSSLPLGMRQFQFDVIRSQWSTLNITLVPALSLATFTGNFRFRFLERKYIEWGACLIFVFGCHRCYYFDEELHWNNLRIARWARRYRWSVFLSTSYIIPNLRKAFSGALIRWSVSIGVGGETFIFGWGLHIQLLNWLEPQFLPMFPFQSVFLSLCCALSLFVDIKLTQ